YIGSKFSGSLLPIYNISRFEAQKIEIHGNFRTDASAVQHTAIISFDWQMLVVSNVSKLVPPQGSNFGSFTLYTTQPLCRLALT
ncbi:hypothetical protein, partial [Pseudomonas syringae]|uniref:hypothetical protein n=1 Tax=Pseudomonas syringae TaxID=317 RepID=UPI0034D58CB8